MLFHVEIQSDVPPNPHYPPSFQMLTNQKKWWKGNNLPDSQWLHNLEQGSRTFELPTLQWHRSKNSGHVNTWLCNTKYSWGSEQCHYYWTNWNVKDRHSYFTSSSGRNERVNQISQQSIQTLQRLFNQNHKCEPYGGTGGSEVRGSTKPSIIQGPYISLQHLVPTHQVDVETFHRTSETSELLVALEEMSGDCECLY